MIRFGRSGTAVAMFASGVVALAYRFVYGAQLGAEPALLEPVLDGAAHLEWARGLLAGSWPGGEPFFRAPGYVAWLAGLLSLTGDDPVQAARLQLWLGALVPVGIAALAARTFGPAAAWIAGLGAALYPPLVFFDAQLLAVFLAVPLTVAALWLSLRALDPGAPARFALGAALLWSLAAVVRPPLLIAGLALPWFLRADRRRAGLTLGLLLLLPLLATARNAAVGDPVFLASQGGLNFHLGSGPRANGVAATFHEAPGAVGYRMIEAAEAIAERESGEPLRPSQVSTYWTKRTLSAIADEPSRWLALLAKKAYLLPAARELPNNHDPALFAEILPALRLPGWAVWWPLAVVGWWVGRRERAVRYLLLTTGLFALVTILFFVNARFRMPLVPLVLVFGAGGVVGIAGALRRRAWRPLAMAGAAAVIAAAISWSNPYGIPREPWINSYVLVAEAERNRGEPVRSLRWIERALEREPGLYVARMARLELLERMGRVQEALADATRLVEAAPADLEVRRRLVALLDRSGRPAEAMEQLEAAVRLDPSAPGLRTDRALLLRQLGEPEEARRILTEEVAAGGPDAGRAAAALQEMEAGTGTSEQSR